MIHRHVFEFLVCGTTMVVKINILNFYFVIVLLMTGLFIRNALVYIVRKKFNSILLRNLFSRTIKMNLIRMEFKCVLV